MQKIVNRAFALAAELGFLSLLPERTTLPKLKQRSISSAFLDTANSRLGRSLEPLFREREGVSGIFPLADAHDAFAARMRLVQAAERSLDLQYYLWHADLTGTLLFSEVLAASKRGVRVRLLLDDNNTPGMDNLLIALAAEPGIEIRLFNPYRFRRFRILSYLTDLHRVNRRMHNKSFTVDNQVTIVGGRNIGDEYFAASEGLLFQDLDVLAIGPVVNDVSADFDRYWASGSAHSVSDLLPSNPGQSRTAELLQNAFDNPPEHSQPLEVFETAVEGSNFLQAMDDQTLEFIWAPTRLVSDNPLKGLGLDRDGMLLIDKLDNILGTPKSDLYVISPYFVPTAKGASFFSALAGSDISVKILTNSFEATDVGLVHSGYIKRRKQLLQSGVILYESKAATNGSVQQQAKGSVRISSAFGSGTSSSLSSSASSLHAKTFAIDHQRLFVGSFNFDPRSANLNTELGLIIESPLFATELSDLFDMQIQQQSYRVELTRGQLNWIEIKDDEEITHETEPGSNIWQRTILRLLAMLPIEWLL